ncbi:Putative signal recognition particle, SRP14 subunit, signal recognition particle, SRP9/SRP14 subunit [Septoria linicola]|uniref:Signal recognition particle subunit SRP14 n=1 Tax=Septoria linicola TaxID=215465 RepID=A0A9Q9EMI4_9PEZI|nr:putative signal recognition particle, SRP14 subunit, signal recognition particle, SRP9/SRP14 subunit [Septoria linicola]USW56070.1 Putative signal recognition particle, SRP14 subunit, signal recognition particle, SRP9/SRP14 subunit [Septoria linicola]
MAKAHLSNDEFFTNLGTLISKVQEKGHGSVYLTQKRLTYDASTTPADEAQKVADDPLWDLNPPNPLPLIVRATDGKSQSKDRKKNKDKVKLSTIVQPDDLESFFTRYAEVCKAGMQNLKKRDRSKRKKVKAKGKKDGEKK